MAVDRSFAEGLGDELSRLYEAVEVELARGVARRLAAGKETPDWLDRKLAAAGDVRRFAQRVLDRLSGRGRRAAERSVRDAYERGVHAADAELRRAERRVQEAIPGRQNIQRLAGALADRLDATGPRVVRSVVDAYRQTVTAGAATVLGGATTRREAGARVWNRLLDQGFAGFTDARGRNWSLAGYVDMATRTTTAQAAVAGQLDRQAQYGLDLVIVSNAPQECERCRPWEGKILTRGPEGEGGRTLRVEHATEDREIEIHVAGSVDEAIRAGLLHPNCRHSLSAYLPGLTRVPTHTADPEGDKARRKLRELERQVRAARLQEAGALTPEMRARATARIRDRQAAIREHVKATEHLGIRRKPERERLELGNAREQTSRVVDNATNAGASNTRAQAYAARQDAMRNALAAGTRGEQQLGGGQMARVDLISTNNGERFVRKLAKTSSGRDAKETQDAEELAALVGDALGARVPAVLRSADDVVHMEYVDGEVYGALTEAAIRRGTAAVADEDARRIALLDQLIGNTDRNAGNIIVSGDRATGIDHGAAFQWHPEYNPPDRPGAFSNVFSERFVEIAPARWGEEFRTASFKPGALRPGEAAELRAALEPLRAEFRRLGRIGWYNNMLRRLTALERAGGGS